MRRYGIVFVIAGVLAAGVGFAVGNAHAATIGNIALNKPTSASSARAGHPASLAVDGDATTLWQSAKSGAQQSIAVDLGALFHVGRTRLVWGSACAKAYQIQTSRDKVTWLTAFTVTNGRPGAGDVLYGTGEPTFGRYVRVLTSKPCKAKTGYALAEFEIYGDQREEVPPTAPTDPRATGATPSSISLAWNPGTDNVAVRAYEVYVDGTRVAATGATAVTVRGLKPDTAYTFTIVSRDAAFNRSGPSTPVTARTRTGEGVPPSAPQNPDVTDVAPPCVTIVWDPSTDNVGVVGYDVTRDSDPPVTVTTPSIRSCGLSGGRMYSFSIVARDAAGNVSEPTIIDVGIPSA